MIKFNKPPVTDQKIAVYFDIMAERFKDKKEFNAKLLLDKLKGMEYNSKSKNKEHIDKHRSNVELYNHWRGFIRGGEGVGFGYDIKSEMPNE